MIAPVARMMLPLSGGPFKKIRFSMIANNLPESLVFDYLNFLRETGTLPQTFLFASIGGITYRLATIKISHRECVFFISNFLNSLQAIS